jgi:hypothetical protein
MQQLANPKTEARYKVRAELSSLMTGDLGIANLLRVGPPYYLATYIAGAKHYLLKSTKQ